jgi:hypothetical protein
MIYQLTEHFQPVKVVSSMGEQSVGKSFALNHLVDTSFVSYANNGGSVDVSDAH